MNVCFLFFLIQGCELPDQSLFQKGEGSLYQGGVPAEELDIQDGQAPVEDTGTIEDTGESEDTALEDTGMVDSGSENTGTTEDTGNTE